MEKMMLIPMQPSDLQVLIIESVNACLQNHKSQAAPTATPEPTPGQLLTKKEAAKLLACSPSTIDNAARAGKLPRHYIGKSVRFLMEDVQKLPMQKEPQQKGRPLLKRSLRKV